MIWKYIKADTFFKTCLPELKNYKHKIRQKNGRGNPVDFSPDEIFYAAESDMCMHQMAAHLLTETLTTAIDQDDAVNEVKNIITQTL